MDPRLLRAYNEELTYLRETAREFGEENEVVAGRLGLKTPTDADPYVERLLEGVAFLGARVKLKLQDQFPDFTQHLLHAIQPHYLAPTPSMCVAAFEPQEGDQALIEGFKIPRLSELTATAKDHGGAAVTFRTGHEVTLWPIRIVETEYLASRAAVAAFAEAAGVRAEAGLRVRFATVGGAKLPAISPPSLPVFISGSETLPGELYRQFLGETLAVIGRSADSAAGQGGWVRLPAPEAHGFDDDCALLPAEGRSFSGYRLLTEYFACPERFLFFALRDLGAAFSQSPDACDVVFLFSRSAQSLAGRGAPRHNLRLFATPAVNLFEKQLGRGSRSNPTSMNTCWFPIARSLSISRSGGSPRSPPTAARTPRRGRWRRSTHSGPCSTTGAKRCSTCRGSPAEGCRPRSNACAGAPTILAPRPGSA